MRITMSINLPPHEAPPSWLLAVLKMIEAKGGKSTVTRKVSTK